MQITRNTSSKICDEFDNLMTVGFIQIYLKLDESLKKRAFWMPLGTLVAWVVNKF